MLNIDDLHHYLDDYLHYDKSMDIGKIDSFMANGLMVRGREKVQKIGFGVSASLELFKLAKEENCDALVVHHSFNLPSSHRYDSIFQNRIGYLLENGISLFGYHFLLDSHPEIGNNVQILKTIGVTPDKPYLHHDNPWGWTGIAEREINMEKILANLKPYLSESLTVYEFGPEKIRKVIAISGKGAPAPAAMQEIIDEKIDLYITGEVHEWNRELFREAGVNFIAGGHYATEVFGLRALKDKVGGKFPGVEMSWLKLGNPV